VVLICKMEKIFLPGWFNVMQHLLLHLPWEAKVGGPAQFRWMYSRERELKKLRVTVYYKARVEGCIAEAFACKEITNFSSKYFSRANNVNAHTTQYHIIEEVSLSELSILQWKGQKWSKLPEVVCLHVIFCFAPFFISNCHSSITHI
jgi:hypothetical protein